MNRKEFVLSLSSALSATSLLRAAPAPFTLGIGTFTYRNVAVDQMIADLKQLDIREIEMSRPEFMLTGKPTQERFEALKRQLDQAGIRAVSYFASTIKDQNDVDQSIQFARILDAHTVSGDATGDALKRIDESFQKEKLSFGIHNHWFKHKFAYESPEDVLRAIEGMSSVVGATLDTGHMASCRYDPVEAIRKLEPRLKIVHLKDVQQSGDDKNVILGSGIAKIPEVIHELKRIGYRGLVAIEYEDSSNLKPDVTRCVEFARRLLKQ